MATAADKPKRRKFLTLADIEKVVDRPITDVEIPEWGGWSHVRPITAREWEAIQNDARVEGTTELDELIVKPRVLAAGIVDMNGQPIFTLEEADKLMDKSMLAVNRISAAIVGATLASLREETEDEAEQAEAAEATFLAGESGSGEPG